jgi:predicted RNase H-like nuclease (RuvC/YqgF family)
MFWITSIAQFFNVLFSEPAKLAEKETPPQKVDGLVLPSITRKWWEEVGETLEREKLYHYELERAKSMLNAIRVPCKTAEAELNRRREREALNSQIEHIRIALAEAEGSRERCKNRLREEEKLVIFSAPTQWDGGWSINLRDEDGPNGHLASTTRRRIVILEGTPILVQEKRILEVRKVSYRETGPGDGSLRRPQVFMHEKDNDDKGPISLVDQFSTDELMVAVHAMRPRPN